MPSEIELAEIRKNNKDKIKIHQKQKQNWSLTWLITDNYNKVAVPDLVLCLLYNK
jgi:hypothetical protein